MDNNTIAAIVLIGVSLTIYFFPTILAALRGHHNTLGIGMLNLFLGWTGLGWVAALVWACTSNRPQQIIVQQVAAAAPQGPAR